MATHSVNTSEVISEGTSSQDTASQSADTASQNTASLCYKDQFDTDVYWFCDRDEQNRITSIFVGHGERYMTYMDTEQQVLEQEAMLKEKGWVKCDKPKIEITHDKTKTAKDRLHDKIQQKEMSRQQKRKA